MKQNRIIIFQIASLGDAVVSLPAHLEIRRRHPGADFYLLTNIPIDPNFPTERKMVAAESVFGPMGLFDGVIPYPMPLRGMTNIRSLHRALARVRPACLYYLIPETKTLNLVRHYLFFRLCGIQKILGMPWSRDLRFPLRFPKSSLWESEASRMLRSIGAKKLPGPPEEADRQLHLSAEERQKAASMIAKHLPAGPFVVASGGGKVPINNWGDENWTYFLSAFSERFPGLGIVFVGSADEHSRNARLARAWRGPKLNTCGLFSPRETAAVIENASLFVGHDTGTLHLAGAVGTKILGIFSGRNVPGKWFSDRPSDTFLFKPVECMGCQLVQIADCPNQRKCIMQIAPRQVLDAATAILTPDHNRDQHASVKSSSRQ